MTSRQRRRARYATVYGPSRRDKASRYRRAWIALRRLLAGRDTEPTRNAFIPRELEIEVVEWPKL
jgi:hypothetical protein